MQTDGKSRIRSFVRREGRITPAQIRALDELLPRYGIPDTGILEPEDIFGRTASCWIEVGFGNGDNLLTLARLNPATNFLGIEVHRPGVGRLLNQVQKDKLENVRVACEDACDLLRHRVRESSIERIILLFPDPWPKKKHHKRRIVQPDFVELVARALVAGGIFQLATDWTPYAEHMLEIVGGNADFTNLSDNGDFIPRPEERPMTRFEKRGDRLGHDVHDLMFRRN